MANEAPLTSRQRMVLHALVRIWDKEQLIPTLAELRDYTGIASLRGVSLQLDALERKGYIKRVPGSPRAISILQKSEPAAIKQAQKGRTETKQLRRFISFMRRVEGISLRLKDTAVSPGNHSRRNYDALLLGPAGTRWAVELTQLHESDQVIRNSAVWSDVAAELRLSLLRWHKVTGAYYISLPLRFEVSKSNVHSFSESLALKLFDAISNMGQAKECSVGGIQISRIDGIRGNRCFLSGTEVGWINAPGTMRERLQKALDDKREQLSTPDVYRRILVITNYYRSGDKQSAIDGLAQIDLAKYPEIDRIYIEFKSGVFDRVYDRTVGELLRKAEIPSKEPERGLAFDYLLRLIRANSDEAWPVVEGLLEGAELWRTFPSTVHREALVELAQTYGKREVKETTEGHESLTGTTRRRIGPFGTRAMRIIDRLIEDPDPPRDGVGDRYHAKVAASEDPVVITSVRGRLCWAIQQLALTPHTVGKAFDFVVNLLGYRAEKESISEGNLYMIQQSLIPLMEVARRRGQLGERDQQRLRRIILLLLEKYSSFIPIAQYLSHVLINYRELSDKEAERAITKLTHVDEASQLYLYFGYYREKHLGRGYDGTTIRRALTDQIGNGTDSFRADLAWQIAQLTSDEPDQGDYLQPVITALAAARYSSSTHIHLSSIAENVAKTSPILAGTICECLLRVFATSTDQKHQPGRALPHSISTIFEVLADKGHLEKVLTLLELLVEAVEREPAAMPYRLGSIFATISGVAPRESDEPAKKLQSMWSRLRSVLPHLGNSWES